MEKSLKDIIEGFSLSKLLIITGVMLGVLNLILFIFQVPAFYDFYTFYSRDATKILAGLIPYVNFNPYYPILADYYFVSFEWVSISLFEVIGLELAVVIKLIVARIFQSLIYLGCLILVRDIMNHLEVESINWQLIWFIASPVLLFFAIIQVNFDILMVFFLFLALAGFLRESPFVMGLAIGLGVMVKVFPIVLLVPIVLFYLKRKQVKNLAITLISVIGIYFVFYLPFSVARLFLTGQSLFNFVTNYVDFFLIPLQGFENHPLNVPYFFLLPLIAVTFLTKNLLKLMANVIAILIVLVYCSWSIFKDSEEESKTFKILIFSLFLFFLFQPYITPWYIPWVLAPYYLLEKKHPGRESAIYQPIIFLACTIAGWIQYYFNNFILSGYQSVDYNFLITPNLIFPMFVNMLRVILLQFLVILFFVTNSSKWKRVLIPGMLTLLIISGIGSILLFFF
ncbi:MAG: glycosyltransferase 87 family protein [Candidatus Helarchaeota archaeon]